VASLHACMQKLRVLTQQSLMWQRWRGGQYLDCVEDVLGLNAGGQRVPHQMAQLWLASLRACSNGCGCSNMSAVLQVISPGSERAAASSHCKSVGSCSHVALSWADIGFNAVTIRPALDCYRQE
jgi:hypothetical protein